MYSSAVQSFYTGILGRISLMAVEALAPCGDCNNSIQFFIINVPSQQLQRQLQTQHNVHIGNKIKSNKQNTQTIYKRFI
jgi:hypothetical protein